MAFVIDYHEPNIEVADKGRLEHVMRRYARYQLLIIDELGYLTIKEEDTKMLFQIINSSFSRKRPFVKQVEVLNNQFWIFLLITKKS